MFNPSVWDNRWQGVDDTLAEMQSDYSQLSTPTFQALTACLHAFAKDQFYFFLEGFQNGRLLPSPEHPAENVLRATLDQASFDMTAVQLAVDQRQDGSVAMQNALAKADALAQDALSLATRARLIKPAATATYFTKSTHIRVIPYAPLALVGLPFTCVTTAHDFLAIPHEVGHYVYRHAPGLAATLDALLLPALPIWAEGWLEEIFADVYGALVAGPVIGLDFQDLLLDNPISHLTQDDGEHPADAIRPFIYTRLLQEMGCKKAAVALDARWQQALSTRGKPRVLSLSGGLAEVSVQTAREVVEETAVSILQYLTTQRGVKATAVWSQDLPNAKADPETLYTAFELWLKSSPNTQVNQLKLESDQVVVYTGDEITDNRRRLGETQTWRDWFKTQSRANPHNALPTAVWTELFAAGGWPMKGPEGGGGSGG
ncbi:MAG: hypothetical protein IPM39_24255 [Chloroflexi bacterium]|nr:hypothetical protein [Chloroflexota bacterium]